MTRDHLNLIHRLKQRIKWKTLVRFYVLVGLTGPVLPLMIGASRIEQSVSNAKLIELEKQSVFSICGQCFAAQYKSTIRSTPNKCKYGLIGYLETGNRL